jgi:hypothetical protein
MVQTLVENYQIGRFYVKKIDESNEGLFIRLLKNGEQTEFQIDLTEVSEE